MKIAEKVFLVFIEEKAKDGRQNTNHGNPIVAETAARENGEGKKSEQRAISISSHSENDTDHAVAGNPFVHQDKYEKDKNENQMHPLTDFFSPGLIQALIPVDAQDVNAK